MADGVKRNTLSLLELASRNQADDSAPGVQDNNDDDDRPEWVKVLDNPKYIH